MRNSTIAHRSGAAWGLAALMLALSGGTASAEDIYKCVSNGKTIYTADPRPSNGDCQQTSIRNDEPSPDDLARALAEQQLRREQDAKDRQANLKEREVLAQERAAAAAARRARAVEQALLQGRQYQPYYEPTYLFPYPYLGGGLRPIYPLPPQPPAPPQRREVINSFGSSPGRSGGLR